VKSSSHVNLKDITVIMTIAITKIVSKNSEKIKKKPVNPQNTAKNPQGTLKKNTKNQNEPKKLHKVPSTAIIEPFT
jgi:hypothetical protein